MDRRHTQQPLDSSSVQTHRATPFKLLLCASSPECLRSDAYETCRRALYGEALLRLSADHAKSAERRTRRQPKTDPRDHAKPGPGWESTRPQYLEGPPGSPQIPVPPARPQDPRTSAGVEHRHHVHPVVGWLCVSRSGDGLVQSSRALTPALKQPRHQLLPRGFRGSDRSLRSTWYLQHRPGGAVHLTGVCKCSTQQRHSLQHGRSRKSTRQYLCRAPMEISEV